jgi:hypothetical protein
MNMLETVTIPCEDGDITYTIDHDKPSQCADLNKLDYDLMLIGKGKLDVELPEDTYDYSKHEWETPKGRLIGAVFAEVDADWDATCCSHPDEPHNHTECHAADCC